MDSAGSGLQSNDASPGRTPQMVPRRTRKGRATGTIPPPGRRRAAELRAEKRSFTTVEDEEKIMGMNRAFFKIAVTLAATLGSHACKKSPSSEPAKSDAGSGASSPVPAIERWPGRRPCRAGQALDQRPGWLDYRHHVQGFGRAPIIISASSAETTVHHVESADQASRIDSTDWNGPGRSCSKLRPAARRATRGSCWKGWWASA